MAGEDTTSTTDSKTTDETKTSTDAKTTDTSSKDTGKDDAKDKAGTASDADKPKDDDGLKKALAATRKERDDLAKKIRDGELAKLPELERYKTLADTLEKENKELKTDNMRRQVAMELGLPWKIGKRLTGETVEEMREDGSDLAKDYKAEGKTTIPDDKTNKKTTNDTKAKGSTVGPTINDKLRALAGRSLS